MFNKKKKETIVEKEVIKCSFCQEPSTGNHGQTFYCSNNKCAEKFWNKQNKNHD